MPLYIFWKLRCLLNDLLHIILSKRPLTSVVYLANQRNWFRLTHRYDPYLIRPTTRFLRRLVYPLKHRSQSRHTINRRRRHSRIRHVFFVWLLFVHRTITDLLVTALWERKREDRETIEKAPQLPEDIEWHFIGNLQSNKVKPLLSGVPNLVTVESVDDEKIANMLDRVVGNIGRKPLKVFVQVNTSGEDSKFGVEPSGCVGLAKHVKEACSNLEFSGLMTIGMADYTSTPENFKLLAKCRSEVCKELGIPEEQCELSMGMSGDFELAIELGSTNVRIGSTIFGAREYPKK